MQDSVALPSEMTVRSTAGTFLLNNDGKGSYRAEANGYVLQIGISSEGDSLRHRTALSRNTQENDGESYSSEGTFRDTAEFLSFLVSWIDGCASADIEDYASDVRYLVTPYGRMAWWAYDTHLDTVPLVFVHGGPGGDSNPVKARMLHQGHPIYLFDQMGCGMSDPIKDLENFRLDEYYDEMTAFIDSIPSDKVILVGASWGAGLSLYYAGRSGFAKVAGLILPSPYISTARWAEDTTENLRDMGGDYLKKFEELVRRQDLGEEFTRIAAEFNARYLFSRACYREWGVASASEEPNEVFRVLCGPNDLVTVGKLKDFDVTPYLDDIRVPTLFVCGDSDEVRVERIVEYHRRVRGSRLSVIPHAGHVLAKEQFESYKAALTAFLEENF